MKIEDYGFLSDTQTAALVGRNGSVDWLCFPRFDSAACFAALLGEPKNGRWLIAPADESAEVTRRYRGHTLILETTFETKDGAVRLIDFMPPRGTNPDIVRIVEGVRGKVALRMELIIRFDYGDVVPWVRKCGDGLEAIAGPNALVLRTPIETRGEDLTTVAEFEVAKGERVPFVLTWYQSHENPPRAIHPEHALRDTEKYWRDWAGCCEYGGKWNDAVVRSLVTLKGLTYAPTGGIVAAATTSLPEKIGGVRNWDYRYCWLRDATFTLFALTRAGFVEEARSWRGWLLRAIAGSPAQMQILYGMHGERRLPEFEIEWLAGYENSRPVRVGNAASKQFQLDVYGEVMSSMYHAQQAGIKIEETDWALQRALMKFLESHWQEPDEGIWEVRGGRKNFTHSKMMAWLGVPSGGAIDRRGWFARERRARALEESPRPNPSGSLRARLQPESESVYPVLRERRARRQSADDADDRVSPDRRRARAQYHRCDRAGSAGARFRAALPAGGGKCRWAARRRRRVSALLVLVRHLPEFAWAQRRSARTFRTPAHVAKRSWFAVGRIRSAR